MLSKCVWNHFQFSTVKIQQHFAFSVLWRTGRVSCLCIQHISTCLYYDEPKPFQASSMLMHVIYTWKPMSLGDIEQDNHTAMIVHTIQHEYAPTAIALSIYPHYKVKSSYDQKGSLTQPRESIIQSAQLPTHIGIYIYIHHAQCYHIEQESKQTLPTFQGYGPVRYRKCKTDIAIPRECGPSKEQEK